MVSEPPLDLYYVVTLVYLFHGSKIRNGVSRDEACIKSIDEKAWRAILQGWTLSKKTPDKDGDVKFIHEVDWTNEKLTVAS